MTRSLLSRISQAALLLCLSVAGLPGQSAAGLAPLWPQRLVISPAQFGLDHEMVFDAARREMIVLASNQRMWRWDGSSLQTVTSSPFPGVRESHALSYDPARSVVVLHGGRLGASQNPILLSDTWEWDGSTWTEIQSSGGPGGQSFVTNRDVDMAFDAVRGTSILYIGTTQTWEWDGMSWTQLMTLNSPMRLGLGSNRSQQMATHPETGRAICFTHNSPGVLYELRDTPAGLDWVDTGATIDPSISFQTTDTHLAVGPEGDLFVFIKEGAIQRLTALRLERDNVFRPVGNSMLGGTFGETRIIHDPVRDVMVYFGPTSPAQSQATIYEFSAVAGRVSSFGSSCGAPSSGLEVLPGQRPGVGSTLSLRTTNMPSVASVMLIGLSRDSSGGMRLPFSLGGFGAPGCEVLTSAECSVPNQPLAANESELLLDVPIRSALIGGSIFCQSISFAPTANPLGLLTSDGLELRIGRY